MGKEGREDRESGERRERGREQEIERMRDGNIMKEIEREGGAGIRE